MQGTEGSNDEKVVMTQTANNVEKYSWRFDQKPFIRAKQLFCSDEGLLLYTLLAVITTFLLFDLVFHTAYVALKPFQNE